jgi:uncharacterized protein YggU (UPF0235/DUF167 family)
VLALLADVLGVRRSDVRIVSGETARRKLVAVEGMDSAQALARLKGEG